jgi:hypothetical protein
VDLAIPATPTLSLLAVSLALLEADSPEPTAPDDVAAIGAVVTFTLDDPNAKLGFAGFDVLGEALLLTGLETEAVANLLVPMPGDFPTGLVCGVPTPGNGFPTELL